MTVGERIDWSSSSVFLADPSTSGLCSGPALHTPVGEFLASFIVLIVFILSIVLSFILVLSLQGTSFLGTMADE